MRQTASSVLARSCATAACVLLLAGCGGSSGGTSSNGLASKSPDQILAAAKAASEGAATVHIDGSVITEGKPISLNMELVAGKGAKGRITVEGNSIDVVELENAFYIRGSAAFYARVGGPAAAKLLEGRWLKAPTSKGEFAAFAQLTNLSKLLASTLSSHGALKSAGTTTIDGRGAVGVTDTEHGGTLYVAETGTPYPLRISKGAGSAGEITFDRWNQPVTLTAPPDPININQLQSGR
jgi:hypothetical protein